MKKLSVFLGIALVGAAMIFNVSLSESSSDVDDFDLTDLTATAHAYGSSEDPGGGPPFPELGYTRTWLGITYCVCETPGHMCPCD